MTDLERYRRVCPAAGTFSKDVRSWAGDNPDWHPMFVVDAQGAHIWGDDRKHYLDWVCALGAIILGYGYPEWNRGIVDAMTMGGSFSLPHILEMEVAEKLVDILGRHVPGWSPDDLQVRFTKTGSECTEAAVRLARAVTGRDLILRCSDSYLGWGNTFIATTPPAHGIPAEYAERTILFNYGQDMKRVFENQKDEYESAKRIFSIPDSEFLPSCVILEQGIADPPNNWYKELREQCTESGALLILDETASGFRYDIGGAAEHFNIMPDLACYGKALGNGAAIAALVGRREYMQWFGRVDPVFVSGTFCGELFGLAGAKAVLEVMEKEDVIGHLRMIGGALQSGLTKVLSGTDNDVLGHDVRHIIRWASDEWHAYLVSGMAKNQVLLNRPNYSTLAHTVDDVEYTIDVMGSLVDQVKRHGLPVIPKEYLPRVLFRNR